MELKQLIPSDALSEALQLIDLRARVYPVAEFTAPWGLRFPNRSAHFHYLQSGRAVVALEQPDRTIEMGVGDVIVLEHSSGHRILSHADGEAIDVDDAVKAMETGVGLRIGGGGERTQMICGKFVMDEFT